MASKEVSFADPIDGGYMGRNGSGRSYGLVFSGLTEEILVHPINSKGTANCTISIPRDPATIDQIIQILEDVKKGVGI